MDARERIESQPRRPSIKRPWDEDITVSETTHTWHSAVLPLPPIEPYRRASLSRQADIDSRDHIQYSSESRDVGGAKRPRYEGHGYDSLSRENLDLNIRLLHTQIPHSTYDPTRSSQGEPSFNVPHHTEGWERQIGGLGGDAGPSDTLSLCQRCRRLTSRRQEADVVDTAEEELASLGTSAVNALSNLHAILLRAPTGRTSGQREASSAGLHPVGTSGLKDTLKRLLVRIYEISDLADKIVQHVPQSNTPEIDRKIGSSELDTQDGSVDIMKRRNLTDLDDPASDTGDSLADSRYHVRRRSVASLLTSNEDYHTIRPTQGYNGLYSNLDGQSHRASIMNPPPAPSRQLPSPPGRSLPSPTSVNFPSPSAGSYASSSHPGSLSQPSVLQHTPGHAYLPPIGPTQSPDALQAHSAALQHEVSVQKIALSSLQGEHDKLLAAISRMQTRASALEKKHEVSDAEIISLTEEKLRLQSQVSDLERDVEELTRSRDGFRQSSVEEGAQYIEIVKRASRLEEMAGEERKAWAKLKVEMEQRIESLAIRNKEKQVATSAGATGQPVHSTSMSTPPSSIEETSNVKPEATHLDQPMPEYPLSQGSDTSLRDEILRLRSRCAEAEDALRAMRDSSRSMEDIVVALGLAGKSITERANRALGSSFGKNGA